MLSYFASQSLIAFSSYYMRKGKKYIHIHKNTHRYAHTSHLCVPCTHKYAHRYVDMHTCTHIHKHTCPHTCPHTSMYMHTHTPECTHTYTYVLDSSSLVFCLQFSWECIIIDTSSFCSMCFIVLLCGFKFFVGLFLRYKIMHKSNLLQE